VVIVVIVARHHYHRFHTITTITMSGGGERRWRVVWLPRRRAPFAASVPGSPSSPRLAERWPEHLIEEIVMAIKQLIPAAPGFVATFKGGGTAPILAWALYDDAEDTISAVALVDMQPWECDLLDDFIGVTAPRQEIAFAKTGTRRGR
jgi:hypothetical protein